MGETYSVRRFVDTPQNQSFPLGMGFPAAP